MDTAIFIALIIVVAALLVLATGLLARRPRGRAAAEGPTGRSIVVTLDIGSGSAGDPRVERLIDDAAARLFTAARDVEQITFTARTGAKLGVKTAAGAADLHWNFDQDRAELAGGRTAPGAFVRAEAKRTPEARRPIADLLELHPDIRARIYAPADPIDVVKAILESSGRRATRVDSKLRCGDTVIVATATPGSHVDLHALNDAFMTFVEGGTRYGIALVLGPADRLDIHRRERLQPALVHADLHDIQRMADAATLGGDPLQFARETAVLGEPIT